MQKKSIWQNLTFIHDKSSQWTRYNHHDVHFKYLIILCPLYIKTAEIKKSFFNNFMLFCQVLKGVIFLAKFVPIVQTWCKFNCRIMTSFWLILVNWSTHFYYIAMVSELSGWHCSLLEGEQFCWYVISSYFHEIGLSLQGRLRVHIDLIYIIGSITIKWECYKKKLVYMIFINPLWIKHVFI